MQPQTDFWLSFRFIPPFEYRLQLQKFIDETMATMSEAYLPPRVWFPNCNRLNYDCVLRFRLELQDKLNKVQSCDEL